MTTATAERDPLRVLVYTSLFPNSVKPVLGTFVLERLRHVQKLANVSVVAPVPFFPRLKLNRTWYEYATIPSKEQVAGFHLDHPRFVVIPKVAMGLHGISMFAGSFGRVWQKAKEHRFDVIDAHYVYPDGFAAVMLGKMLGIPVVVSARGSDINLFPKFKTIRPLIQRVLEGADALIAVSHLLKERMIELGCPPEKITVIGNGIDCERFRPMSQDDARTALGLPLGRRIAISVGHLKEGKGFHILLDAIAALRDRGRDVMLVVVGDGPFRPHLEQQIQRLGLQESVKLAGAQQHENLPVWYNAADVFCLASASEGCPNVVLEAMACGLPVITTNVGVELVTSPALGILTERSASEFCTAIDDAVQRTWNRAAIVAHAQSRNWNDVASSVLRVFQSAVRKRHMVALEA